MTLIIPTYNRAHLVTKAIESALSQSYPNIRVVVVDDGSTDDTDARLAPFRDDPRVEIVHHPRNRGVTAAKNTGIDHVRQDSPLFGILDSDDTLHPDAVENLVAGFESAEAPPSQVFGWCRDAHTGEATGLMTHRSGVVTYEDALCGRFHGEFWQIVRSDALQGRRFDELAAGAEASLWWPLLKQSPALLLDVVVRDYDRSGVDRVNRPAFTSDGARKKAHGYAAILRETGTDMRAACPDRYSFMRLEQGKWEALAGNPIAAWQAVAEAWRTTPSARAVRVALLALVPARISRRLYRTRYVNAQ